ncbi:TetR/AcrR family transcriptional regulator [Rhodococcus sp. BGS-1C]|uniref:TetR/AcrR family transcriptional regulator n=1 Tax=unclassified Rhodococcus (in: high G+C Gram-positive bacteria) TaxID=192944 RepID=UPI0019D0CB4C|nr:TetR/AcrR family transcriptional regulator [Rhodococcus sp. KRD197]
MPRQPDHSARRAEIADALVRVASRDGLHAVTMRSVAAEAEVSLRLVQYYFVNKEQLLIGALKHLEDLSQERWQRRLAGLGEPVPARALVEAFLLEALPSDDASRAFHLVGMSYAVLAMTDPAIAEQPFVSGVNNLEQQLAEELHRAAAAGELTAGVDADIEATKLVTIVNGLGNSILVGQRSAAQATVVVDYHVNQLFGDS